MRASLIAVVLPCAISLASCTPSRSDTDPSSSHARSGPLRQLNPSPMQGYRIRLTIQDAPGPFVLTDATAQYDVVNEVRCGEDSPHGGVYRMTSNELLDIKKLDEVTYEGVVYLDQILDGDYYGNGICKWELTEVRAVLSATGDVESETQFAPHFPVKAIKAVEEKKTYFWRGMYPRCDVDGYFDSGEVDRKRVDRGDNELFVITMGAKEADK